MEITFQQIQPNDLNIVLTLFKEAAQRIAKKKIRHWQYWHNPPTEKTQWIQEGIAHKEFFFVNNTPEQRVGMVRILNKDLLYWGEKNDKATYIHSLVVKEEFAGKGMGKIILQKIENKAKKNGCQYLRLDADSKNPKLCEYYEKQGFQKVGTKKLPLSVYNLYEKGIPI